MEGGEESLECPTLLQKKQKKTLRAMMERSEFASGKRSCAAKTAVKAFQMNTFAE